MLLVLFLSFLGGENSKAWVGWCRCEVTRFANLKIVTSSVSLALLLQPERRQSLPITGKSRKRRRVRASDFERHLGMTEREYVD